jgi:hypothetical protein
MPARHALVIELEIRFVAAPDDERVGADHELTGS